MVFVQLICTDSTTLAADLMCKILLLFLVANFKMGLIQICLLILWALCELLGQGQLVLGSDIVIERISLCVCQLIEMALNSVCSKLVIRAAWFSILCCKSSTQISGLIGFRFWSILLFTRGERLRSHACIRHVLVLCGRVRR